MFEPEWHISPAGQNTAVGLGRRFGRAWVLLTITLALHVADEALTGFLEVYNPIVRSTRARLGWFPMPEFTFEVWLAGLCVLVLLLFALSPLAYRRATAVRFAAYPYASIMLLNGCGHLAGSVYLGRWAPGATTAPLLLAASLNLFAAARQFNETSTFDNRLPAR